MKVTEVQRAERDPSASERPARRVLRFLPILLLVLALVAVLATGAHEALSLEELVEQRMALRAYVTEHLGRAVAYYVLVYVVAVSLSLPGSWWFTVTGGFLFGWLMGGVLAVISATLGATVIFFAASTSFGELLARKAGPRLQRLADGFRRNAFTYMLTLRLIPVIPFWINNIAPALFEVRLRTFALATLLGIIPGTFAFAVAGDGLDSVLAVQQELLDACRARGETHCRVSIGAGDLVTPELIAAIAALGLMGFLPMLFRRWFGKSLTPSDEGNT